MKKFGDQQANSEMARILIFEKPISQENMGYIVQLFGLLAVTTCNDTHNKLSLEHFFNKSKADYSGKGFDVGQHLNTICAFALDRINELKWLDPIIDVTRAIATSGATAGSDTEKRSTLIWKENVLLYHKPIIIAARAKHAAFGSTEGSLFNCTATELFFTTVKQMELSDRISHYGDLVTTSAYDNHEELQICQKSITLWQDSVREVPDYIQRALFGHKFWKVYAENTKAHKAGLELMLENGLDPENPDPKYFKGLRQTLHK